jgi:hypothetical protein
MDPPDTLQMGLLRRFDVRAATAVAISTIGLVGCGMSEVEVSDLDNPEVTRAGAMQRGRVTNKTQQERRVTVSCRFYWGSGPTSEVRERMLLRAGESSSFMAYATESWGKLDEVKCSAQSNPV